MYRLIMIIFSLGLFAQQAFAVEPGALYGGLQYAQVTYDEEDFEELEPTALIGRIGRFMTENVSIEGRLGAGLEDDDIDIVIPGFGTIEAEVEVNTLYGFYAAVHSDPSKDVSIYGIVGVSKGELEFSALGLSEDEDDSGLSYGIGLNFGKFNVEYMSYLDEDEYEVTALSIGFVSSFD